jgi:hypothetical protein
MHRHRLVQHMTGAHLDVTLERARAECAQLFEAEAGAPRAALTQEAPTAPAAPTNAANGAPPSTSTDANERPAPQEPAARRPWYERSLGELLRG